MATSNPIDSATPLAGPVTRVQTSAQQSTAASAQSIVQAFASANQSSTVGGSNDPPVYLGTRKTSSTGQLIGGQGHSHGEPGTVYGTEDNTMTLSQVAGQYYSWDANTKNKFLTQLSLAGYDVNSMTDDKLASAWASYAQQASDYLKNGKKLTPWDVMAKDRQQAERNRTVTQTQTTSNVSTAQDAHALFTQASQSLLGRDPTSAESRKFTSALNAFEKAHPTVSTTTSNYTGGQLTNQSTNTTGGVSDAARQDMAMQNEKSDPEYGAYQAATTYFDAMMQMVGGG